MLKNSLDSNFNAKIETVIIFSHGHSNKFLPNKIQIISVLRLLQKANDFLDKWTTEIIPHIEINQDEVSLQSTDDWPPSQFGKVTVHSQMVRKIFHYYITTWIENRINIFLLFYKTHIKLKKKRKRHTCKWRRWWARKVPWRKIISGSSIHASWGRWRKRRASSHVRASCVH